jgi:hypothetical protein
MIESDTTYATTLFAMLVDRLPDEKNPLKKVLQWHPTTIRMELEAEIGGSMSVMNGQKLMAAIDIVTSDSFFQRVPVFVNYCNVLSNEPLAVGTFDWADAEECGWGIIEGLLLNPPDEGEEPFSTEIRRHLGYVLETEGILSPPDVLRIAIGDQQQQDFSGLDTSDPTMFSGQFKMQSDEADEIEQALKSRLRELLNELEQAPFRSDVVEGYQTKLRKGLR